MAPPVRADSPRSHALRVLELDEVLDLVARRTVGPAAAAALRGAAPLDDPAEVERQLDAVDELRTLLEEEAWEPDALPDAATTLARLRLEGAVLDPEELLVCGRLLAAARAARRELEPKARPEGLVAARVARLWEDRGLEDRIAGTFDEAGAVADGASPELRRIRRELRSGRSRLVERLEGFAGSLPDRVRVPDGSVTVRGGRYCIPIRREGKGSVGGLVHDASGSGQTLFVEPPLAVEAMNELRELEASEGREVHRILESLSAALREAGRHDADGGHRLSASYEALVALDSLRARAAFAVALGGVRPELVGPGEAIRIRGGRHPLLAARGEVVPFDLDLEPGERVLLISGPNAGGKTVLLKSIGLFAVLARCGVIPPVGRGTRLPRFRSFFAIIGDEQSIEASLSTFGAQARNLSRILRDVSEGDLVLIDEIGSATDPAEGAALAAATLAALAGRARLTVATTHLGALKGLADEGIPAVNASLQFDARRLEPTYRLERDRPGRSYALEIAARLGVPEDVLRDARSRLDADHREMDEVLAGLEEERHRAEELRSELERRETALSEAEARVETLRETLERETREAERERLRARENALRDARSEVEEIIARLERDAAGVVDAAAVEATKRAARSTVESRLRETKARAEALPEPEPRGDGERPAVGDPVSWSGSGRPGVLVEIRGDRGVVEVDGVRLTVPMTELGRAGDARAAGAGPRSAGGGSAPLPDLAVQSEIDIRGLRADEVAATLVPALDAAIVADLPRFRIIHGKGTGALRSVVWEMLSEDPRKLMYRTEDARAGGAGVTVVELDAGR